MKIIICAECNQKHIKIKGSDICSECIERYQKGAKP